MTRVVRAVIDVNVLVSAVRTPNGLCGRLLQAAIGGRWQPVVSPMLFEELEDVLARPAFRDVIGEEAIDRFLAGLLAIVEWVEDPKGVAAAVSRDPDDDYLVALANSARADLLLSGDRDLTEIADPPLPIETPGQFLQRLE
ncbi:MAG TPA: putative toxin-antitoxin system toxin component, PIN family [Solirubrobacteraceae bacterium]|nr:putative toxin-antitoxin system toxin component, PIN family [Solirubrobacteraceae bacterium]